MISKCWIKQDRDRTPAPSVHHQSPHYSSSHVEFGVEIVTVSPSTTIYSNYISDRTRTACTINQAVKDTIRIAHSYLDGSDGVLCH